MPKWTEEQTQAIYKKGKNIIVSAGAGSGKTAVLSQRVLEHVKSGINIDELLILTFTNAAAQEMKERIRKKIKEVPELKDQLDKIDIAYITTFDAYSLSLVKKYHDYLNISNKINIIDNSIMTIEKEQILEEIFLEYYESKNEKFLKLINDFCLKDYSEIKRAILTLNNKLDNKYDKEKILDTYIDSYYQDDVIDKYINEYVKIVINNNFMEQLGFTDVPQRNFSAIKKMSKETRMAVPNKLRCPELRAFTTDNMIHKLAIDILTKYNDDEKEKIKQLYPSNQSYKPIIVYEFDDFDKVHNRMLTKFGNVVNIIVKKTVAELKRRAPKTVEDAMKEIDIIVNEFKSAENNGDKRR